MAIDALMLDNSGTKNVPVTDLEWDDWVPASATRNYVLGDPLLDWLDQHGETKGFVQDQVDERTDFTEFIFGKGIEFERRVVDHLRALDIGEVRTINAGGSVAAASRNLDLAVETWHAMVDGVAVIDQGVLRDPASRTYGLPDLLVRSDVLAGLFPENLSAEQATVAAPDLGIGNYHYVVVDIKYTTLNLAPSGLLSNSGSSVAYKTQLHIYNRALSRLQGYQPPRAFLLGRGWKQTVNSKTNKVDNCMDRLASVEHNEITPGGSLFLRSVAAAGWIRRMRRDGDNWDVLPQPTVDELSPNAAGEAGVWKTVVKRIVAESKDLTVLRNVGADRRRKANQAGLFAWTDPAVTAESVGVTGKTAAPLLDALLDVNRTAGELVRPDCVAASRWEWINTPPLEFYVDFETVSDINDDFCALPNRGGQPLVFMVGCGHVENGEWQFECFVADQLTETAEADIIDQWHDHMNTVTARLDPAGTPKVIHWSGHEVSSLTAAAKRHGAASQHPELNWFDFLNKVIKAEPVVVNGSHGFGLKDITKAMHRHGLVDTNWQNGPADGLGAMVGAWWCQSEVDNSRAVNLMDLDLMHEIRDYNEVDCKAMLNIVDYLREHH